jgi:3-hydroxyisobutyrate dehydrogenase
MAHIGFIGLGNMGGPMARNLLKAGHRLRVFDLMPALLAKAVEAGATAAASAAEAVREVEAVVTMLPAGRHAREVYLGAGRVLESTRPGTLLIDCSTIDVETARALATSAAAAGRPMVDAPVSGGTGGAEAGTLTFMVGGSDEAFAAARPILEAMGKTIVHAGGPGTGQAAKICNNMILGISMIAVSEAFSLAEKLGLDHQKLFDISAKSSGQCWSLTSYCPVPGPVPNSPANRDYRPGFTADMMLKDLRLSQEAAGKAGANTPLGEAATALYTRYAESGQGGSDFSGIIRMLREKR